MTEGRAPIWGWTVKKKKIGSMECRPQWGQRTDGVAVLEGVSDLGSYSRERAEVGWRIRSPRESRLGN